MERPDPLVDTCLGRCRGAPWLWGAERISPRLAGLHLPCACLRTRFARGYRTEGLWELLPGVCYRRQKPHVEAGSHPVQKVLQPSPLPGDAAQRLGWGMESVLSAKPLMLELNLPQDTLLVGQRWLIVTHPALGTEDVTTATTGRSQWRCQMWRGSVRRSPWKTPWGIHPR